MKSITILVFSVSENMLSLNINQKIIVRRLLILKKKIVKQYNVSNTKQYKTKYMIKMRSSWQRRMELLVIK